MINPMDIYSNPLVLASSSSYRQTLLAKITSFFIARAPGIEEDRRLESAAERASRLAQSKAQALTKAFPKHLIIGSDQVAECNGALLNKPGTQPAAQTQLNSLSGQWAQFHTAVCVINAATGAQRSALDICRVKFRNLSATQIKAYVARDEPLDCAGAFKSEGLGIVLIEKIVGEDPNALVGLPLIKLVDLLNAFDYPVL